MTLLYRYLWALIAGMAIFLIGIFWLLFRQDSASAERKLWIDRIGEKTRLESFGRWLTSKRGLGAYLFFWLLWTLDAFVVPTITYLQYGWYPGSNIYYYATFTVVGLTFGIWVIKKMKKEYGSAIESLKPDNLLNRGEINLKEAIPYKIKIFFLISGIAMLLAWEVGDALEVVGNHSILGTQFSSSILGKGLIPGIFTYITFLIYLFVIVDFVSLYFGTQLFLPRKLDKIRPQINFSDPERRGGMSPLGNLFLKFSQFYFVGLFLYTAMPLVSLTIWPGPAEIGLGTSAFFLGAWGIGIILFFLPILKVHRIIKEKKEKKIEEITNKIREEGNQPGGFLEGEPENLDEVARYIHRYVQFDHAHKLKEYPLDLGKVRDILSIAIMPLVLHSLTILLFF